MKNKTSEILILIAILTILGLLVIVGICGCDMLAQFGMDPNKPILDPNQADALMNIGHATKNIGIVAGNPELVGIGVLIITIAGTAGGVYIKNRK